MRIAYALHLKIDRVLFGVTLLFGPLNTWQVSSINVGIYYPCTMTLEIV